MQSVRSAGRQEPARLLERSSDLDALDDVIAAGCGIALVEGPAGIGKSTLLEAISARRSPPAPLVLSARGSEVESALGFGVVRQLLERHVATMDPEQRSRLLSGVAALAAGVVDPGAEQAEHGTDRSLAVVHALSWVVFRIAERQPLVLVVDDAQWADEASRQLLAYLAARLDGHDVVLIVSSRTPDVAAGDPLLRVLRERADAVVRPALLSPAAVEVLVAGQLGADWSIGAEACHRATGGNPLYLRQLLRRIAAAEIAAETLSDADIVRLGGVDLSDDIDVRLDQAGPDARALALALGALGDPRPAAQVARIARIPSAAAVAAVERLAHGDVVTGDGDQVAFVHPVVREAVLQLLPVGAHRDAARALAAEGADVEEVAVHVARETPSGDTWTVDVLREAARRSIARGAVEDGLRLLDRALAEPPPVDVLTEVLAEAGQAAAWIGRSDGAEMLSRAWQATSDPVTRAERALVLARALSTNSRNMEAADVLVAAEAELGDQSAEVLAALRTHRVIAGLQDVRLVMRTVDAVVGLAERRDDPAAREILGLIETQAIAMGGGTEAQARERLVAAPASDVTAVGWDVRAVTAFSALSLGAYDEAHRMFAEAADHGRRLGSARARLLASSGWQTSAWLRGELDTAIDEGRQAVDMSLAMAAPEATCVTMAVLALSLLDAGEVAEAAALLEAAPDPEQHPHIMTCLLYTAKARLHLAHGDPAEAAAVIRRGDARFAALLPVTVPSPGMWSWRSPLVAALAACGDRPAARDEATRELEQARAWGGSRALGIALRDAAAVDPQNRHELLAESVEVLRDSGHQVELARSLAAVWRGSHDEISRELAVRLATTARARGLVAELEGTAGTAGPVARLTRAERPVVELVAQGLTNAEVAARLHLSQATVKTHLLRAFDKLQVRNRTQLARVWNQPT